MMNLQQIILKCFRKAVVFIRTELHVLGMWAGVKEVSDLVGGPN